jgi:LacI family transcriptional regulator
MSTIKEIARRANVSIGTVDRVIHERGRVSAKTQEKILKIIDELDYKPNVFARHLKLSKTFCFGVLMPYPAQDSSYWELPGRGIIKAKNELTTLQVSVIFYHYDKYSTISFDEVNHDIHEGKLDGLLVAPVLSDIFRAFIEKIPFNLPYVFFDSFIPQTKCISYIGQDSFQSGVLAGKLIDLLLRAQGTVAIIKFIPEDYVIEERTDGFLDYIDKNTGIKTTLYNVDEKQGPEHFEVISRQMLSEHPDLAGIFVTYAATHRFARFIRDNHPDRDIRIIGYDPVDENIRCLQQGHIDFLITQMPERQGYEGIFTLYRHTVLKEKVEPDTLMPMHIVTKENVDSYFNKIDKDQT